MAGGDQDLKQKFKTTKTSVEDLKMGGVEDARRSSSHVVKGPAPQAVSTAGVSKVRVRHPVVLAGMAVLTGIGTAMYYKSLYGEDGPGKGSSETLDSIQMGKIPSPGNASAEA